MTRYLVRPLPRPSLVVSLFLVYRRRFFTVSSIYDRRFRVALVSASTFHLVVSQTRHFGSRYWLPSTVRECCLRGIYEVGTRSATLKIPLTIKHHPQYENLFCTDNVKLVHFILVTTLDSCVWNLQSSPTSVSLVKKLLSEIRKRYSTLYLTR